jgi:hypothetical protein
MFEVPSRGDVKKVMIDSETIAKRQPAQLTTRTETRDVEIEDESA